MIQNSTPNRRRTGISRAQSALPLLTNEQRIPITLGEDITTTNIVEDGSPKNQHQYMLQKGEASRPPPPSRRHTIASGPNMKFHQSLNHRKVNHHSILSAFDEVIRSETDAFRRRTIVEIPEMSETMKEALEEEVKEHMPMRMKKAKRPFENGESSKSDEDEDDRFDQLMGMQKKNDNCYTETTRKLLQRKRELCKVIRYTKPITRGLSTHEKMTKNDLE